MNDFDLRIRMGKKGYEHLSASFSYERFKQRYLNLVKTLLTEKGVKSLIEV